MCAIAGIIKRRNSATAEDRGAVQKMLDAQAHRGPDGQGVVIPAPPSPLAVLGHRRLSIIDLSEAGNQPMSSPDGSVSITYNGEIYNFHELRDELTDRGYRFRSQTDTEVLLHGYKEWGRAALLGRLRGMFSFALWDRAERTLFAGRDRFGIKPFYYSLTDEGLIFASELKGLLQSGLVQGEIDPEALCLYLALGSIPAPKTIYRNVQALCPGHWATFNEQGLKTGQYWNLAGVYSSQCLGPISDKEAGEWVHSALLDSVKAHLVSDVPVGAFLSGGIDSTVIVALMREAGQKKVKTFTVGFPGDQAFDEGRVARRTAQLMESEHAELEITAEMFDGEWDRIFNAMDQPSVDGVNSYFVSKLAREAGAKVALSGLGGDELFGGYPSFSRVPQLLKARRSLLGMRAFRPFLPRLLSGKNHGKRNKLRYLFEHPPDFLRAYFAYRGIFMPGEIRELLSPDLLPSAPNHFEPIDFLPHLNGVQDPWLQVALLESRGYMANQLLRDTDAMSMAHSLEVRVPLVDHLLLQKVCHLAAKTKTPSGEAKPLLSRLIPEAVRSEILVGGKRGFTLPFDRWMRGPLRKRVEECLFHRGQNLFAPAPVRHLWQEYLNGKQHWSRVWALAAIGFWSFPQNTARRAPLRPSSP